MWSSRATGDTDQGATSRRIPVGSPQADKRGDQVHPVGRVTLGRQLFDLGCLGDQTQSIPEPLHDRSTDKHRPFQAIGHFPVETPTNRRQQASLGSHRLASGVHQEKTSRAVRVLGLPGRKTGLAKCCRLLISGHPGQGNRRTQQIRIDLADHARRFHHLGQHRSWHTHDLQQFLVPLQRMNVQQQGSTGVADVGDMTTAPGQTPGQERINRAEQNLATFSARPKPLDFVQQMGDLGSRKIRVQHQPGLVTNHALVARLFERRTPLRGDPTLPHNRIGNRPACLPLPHHRCLALVGNPQCRQVARVDFSINQGRAGRGHLRVPDCLGVMLDMPRCRKNLFELLLGHSHRPSRFVKNNRPAGGRPLVQRQYVL